MSSPLTTTPRFDSEHLAEHYRGEEVGVHIVALPPGYRARVTTPPSLPERVVQFATLATVGAFIGYLDRLVTTPETLAIYLEETSDDNHRLFAILDAPADAATPGANLNHCACPLAKSKELELLLKATRDVMTQGELCELIEETESHWQDGAKLLDLVKFFQARESIKVTSKKPLDGYAGTVMMIESEIDDGSTALRIPGQITIEVPFFEGTAPIELPMKLMWKIQNGQPLFRLRCPDLHRIYRAEIRKVAETLDAWIDRNCGRLAEPAAKGKASDKDAATPSAPKWAKAPLFVIGKLNCYDKATRETVTEVAGHQLPAPYINGR